MKRNIRLLYAHSFLTYFCPYWPYQIIFFSQITHSYTLAMSAIALETFSAVLFDIPTGVMSDKIGRKKTIALGSLAGAIGLGLYAGAHGLILLCIGALFTGLSQCLFNGNNNALMFETLQAEGEANRFAHYRAGRGMWLQIALCLSGIAATPLSTLGLRAVFIVSTIPPLLSIPVSLMFTEPAVTLVEKQKSWALFKQACMALWRNPRLMLLVLSNAITQGVGEAQFKLQAAFIALVWPVWAVGLYRGLHHGANIIGYILARFVVGRIKPFYIFIGRDVYMFVLRIAAVIMVNTISPLLIATSSLMFGSGIVASEALQQAEFTDEQRATMGSLSSSVYSLLFAGTAIAIGWVADHWGVRWGMALAVCLAVTALPINVKLFRREA